MQSDRLHKVLEHVTEVHSLCDVLGEDFIAIVNEVHPGLHEADPGKPTSISDTTLTSLAHVVAMLSSEKTKRSAMVHYRHRSPSNLPAGSLLYILIRHWTDTAPSLGCAAARSRGAAG